MSSSPAVQSAPDYPALVRFLLTPLLDSPESLAIDCEYVASRDRVWIRVALEPTDRGRACGRDGRTLQAMRVVVGKAAALAGQRASLELYGERSPGREESRPGRSPRRGPSSRSASAPKPTPKPTPKPRPRLRE